MIIIIGTSSGLHRFVDHDWTIILIVTIPDRAAPRCLVSSYSFSKYSPGTSSSATSWVWTSFAS